jgi:3-hydroxyacyl-[acyl-carrier-protein] dehydratase
LLIDQLLECEPGRRAVAVKTFPFSDLLFQTHFPSFPIVPGVLQIEMVAQAGAKSLKLLRPDQVSILVSVKSAKFFRPVEPGDRCRITVDITAREEYATELGVVEVEGVRVSQMELLVAFRPHGMPDRPERDLILEAWQRRAGGNREPFALVERADAIVG